MIFQVCTFTHAYPTDIERKCALNLSYICSNTWTYNIQTDQHINKYSYKYKYINMKMCMFNHG